MYATTKANIVFQFVMLIHSILIRFENINLTLIWINGVFLDSWMRNLEDRTMKVISFLRVGASMEQTHPITACPYLVFIHLVWLLRAFNFDLFFYVLINPIYLC